jgi:hypothetical protein
LVQCTIAGIQENTANFTLKLLDINKQYNIIEAAVPHALLYTAASYYQLPPNTSPLNQLQYFIQGEGSDSISTVQDLTDKIANSIYVCGLELYCSAWKDFTVDIVCFYKPNT